MKLPTHGLTFIIWE